MQGCCGHHALTLENSHRIFIVLLCTYADVDLVQSTAALLILLGVGRACSKALYLKQYGMIGQLLQLMKQEMRCSLTSMLFTGQM